ncbi:MAG: ATP-binding protein [Candidatus Vecturithrix sp.]|nr:ATP-binding protein [Candidatus Vecturithrix sp.]
MTENGEASVAGVLLFGINPDRYLPQCGISYAHFAGVELDSDLLDKQNIEGTLDFQVDTGLAVLKHNFLTPSTIVGAKRQETRQGPPDRVLRELLVNSCVHRDYSIAGSRIRILMFDDRLEFITPGRLPNTVTIEKIKAGVSYARNPILVKFMENLRYIDRLGRGLPMVWREMLKLGGSVEFKEIGGEFKVTLFW